VPAPNLWQKDMTEPNLTDHEYLTVKELAQLLRLKERKIYDLAASGQVPCSKATGKLLFPARDIRAWINRARTETPNSDTQADMPRPSIFLGSHDPLLDWAIRQSRCGLASFYDGSMDGWKALPGLVVWPLAFMCWMLQPALGTPPLWPSVWPNKMWPLSALPPASAALCIARG